MSILKLKSWANADYKNNQINFMGHALHERRKTLSSESLSLQVLWNCVVCGVGTGSLCSFPLL